MKVDDLKKAILALSDEDKASLMKEIMPEMCRTVMSDRNFMDRMMSACRQMMGSEMQERMRK